MQESINLNIVECKVVNRMYVIQKQKRINLNIVECKDSINHRYDYVVFVLI